MYIMSMPYEAIAWCDYYDSKACPQHRPLWRGEACVIDTCVDTVSDKSESSAIHMALDMSYSKKTKILHLSSCPLCVLLGH